MNEKIVIPEDIVTYTATIRKEAKDFYFYRVAVQPGGSKMETQQTSPDTTGLVETNPPEITKGQAMGIGQAMNIVNDIVYRAIENAGLVK